MTFIVLRVYVRCAALSTLRCSPRREQEKNKESYEVQFQGLFSHLEYNTQQGLKSILREQESERLVVLGFR